MVPMLLCILVQKKKLASFRRLEQRKQMQWTKNWGDDDLGGSSRLGQEVSSDWLRQLHKAYKTSC